jgi:hypothetical protein
MNDYDIALENLRMIIKRNSENDFAHKSRRHDYSL